MTSSVTPSRVWVVHDELDLPLCRMRIRRGGSGAGHNGVLSVISSLGTEDFVRFRVGIGKPARKGSPAGPAATCLGGSRRPRPRAYRTSSTVSPSALELALEAGVERAMEQYNRPGVARLRGVGMTSLWEATVEAAPGLERWLDGCSVRARRRAPAPAGLADRRRLDRTRLCRRAAAPSWSWCQRQTVSPTSCGPWLAGRPADACVRRGRGVVPGPAAGLRRLR